MKNIAIGDSVWTNVQLVFADAYDESGDEFETTIPRRECLKVCGVNNQDNTIDVALPNNATATISQDDVNTIDD